MEYGGEMLERERERGTEEIANKCNAISGSEVHLDSNKLVVKYCCGCNQRSLNVD